ncbi:Unknown protein, partial [Striga hermonthica]
TITLHHHLLKIQSPSQFSGEPEPADVQGFPRTNTVHLVSAAHHRLRAPSHTFPSPANLGLVPFVPQLNQRPRAAPILHQVHVAAPVPRHPRPARSTHHQLWSQSIISCPSAGSTLPAPQPHRQTTRPKPL